MGLPCAAALAALLLATAPPAAALARESVDLRVRIPRVLALEMEGHPARVRVTEADVARGEVVVHGPRVRIAANDRDGFVLRAQLATGPFGGFEVGGLPAALACECDAAHAAMRVPGNRLEAAVAYRLRLAAHASPGVYRWPLTLSLQDP